MKGISFQSGVEFKLSINGETWSQGDEVTGELEATSKSAPPTPLPEGIKVFLAYGSERKVKAKAADAFTEIETVEPKSAPKVGPPLHLPYQFKLPIDARITDKTGSLYLVYGTASAPYTHAHLKLAIRPHLHIREFCDLLNSHFRFVLKGFSDAKKGYLEAKFDAPDSKDWVSLEQMTVQFKLTAGTLHTRFEFDRLQIDPTRPGTQKLKVTIPIDRDFELQSLIHDFNGRLNKDVATLAIDEVVAEYVAKRGLI